MRKKISFLETFIHFLEILNFSSSVIIKCTFKDDGNWSIIKDIYYCKVEENLNIDVPEKVLIDSVTGDDLKNKSLLEVEGIDMNDLNIRFFPFGMDKFLNNLKVIDINNGRLKEIRQFDLKPFRKLEVIDLQDNDIHVLEEGVFEYNQNLKMIWLLNNKIMHIDYGVFDGLDELSYLSLESNLCIDMETEGNSTALQEIIDYSSENCQNWPFILVRGKMKELKTDLRIIKKMLSGKNLKDISESLNVLNDKVEKRSAMNGEIKFYWISICLAFGVIYSLVMIIIMILVCKRYLG